MEQLSLPNQIASEKIGSNHSQITISPCHPGYGTTLGNALRRVLLSSLPGGAITAVKIKGVDHEFSTLPNVKEDIVEIILNLKNINLKIQGEEAQELELKASGEKKITAGDFAKNSQVEIVNPEQIIATLTDKNAVFEMKAQVNEGRGYVRVEQREKEKLPVGYIAVDAIYSPVKNVNFKNEHIRVGQHTNYDKLILDITTDGTDTPEEAFKQSARILVDHFNFINQTEFNAAPDIKPEAETEPAEQDNETPKK